MNAPSHIPASTEPSDPGEFVSRLSDLTDTDFQDRLSAVFETRGYSVDRDASDPQADLILQIADQLWIVRTSSWRSPAIDVEEVAELIEVVNRNEATGGMLVCAGTYSEAARLKARGTGVRLVNGVELADMLREAHSPDDADACPRCGGSLVERHAADTAHRFRGCSTYPDCRYTAGVAA